MSTDTNRKELLRKLSRNLMVSVPVMTVVAMAGATAVSDNGFSLIPSAEAAQGEAEGEGEGEGEAEGVSEAKKEAVRRPEGYTPYQGDAGSLAEKGKVLFNDTSLSSNGLACATCHTNGAGYADTFSNDYPHFVAMGKSDFGMDMVHLDEMVQICMVAPMASEPLDWASEELAAMTEYMRIEQDEFRSK